jgi:hypothetical protein
LSRCCTRPRQLDNVQDAVQIEGFITKSKAPCCGVALCNVDGRLARVYMASTRTKRAPRSYFRSGRFDW